MSEIHTKNFYTMEQWKAVSMNFMLADQVRSAHNDSHVFDCRLFTCQGLNEHVRYKLR